MKRLTLVAFAISMCSIVFAQEKGVEIQDIERIPMGDGSFTFRYTTGEKKHLEGKRRIILGVHEYLEAEFTNGLPSGSWNVYRYNKLSEKSNYKNGLRDGKQFVYASDGETVVEEFNVTNGKANGRYVKYRSNGQIEKEQEYKDGVEDGVYRTYDEDGNVLMDCFYKAGKEHGKQTKIYSSYTEVSTYENGIPVGRYTKTLTSGTVEVEGEYDAKGKKTGIWVHRKKDGTPSDEKSYKDGELSGVCKEFFTDGSVNKVTNYAKGKKNGVLITYDFSTGNIISELTYVDNLREGPFKRFYYSQGDGQTMREEGLYKKDKEVSRKEYYTNGKLKCVKEDKGKGMETIESYNEKGKKIN